MRAAPLRGRLVSASLTGAALAPPQPLRRPVANAAEPPSAAMKVAQMLAGALAWKTRLDNHSIRTIVSHHCVQFVYRMDHNDLQSLAARNYLASVCVAASSSASKPEPLLVSSRTTWS